MSTHKAAGGKASQHVSPAGKRLETKVFSGQMIKSGEIIIRQRGTKFTPGAGVKAGRDHTLYAIADGKVKFGTKLGKSIVTVVTK
jgi:large subunit ribosomal protein L27